VGLLGGTGWPFLFPEPLLWGRCRCRRGRASGAARQRSGHQRMAFCVSVGENLRRAMPSLCLLVRGRHPRSGDRAPAPLRLPHSQKLCAPASATPQDSLREAARKRAVKQGRGPCAWVRPRSSAGAKASAREAGGGTLPDQVSSLPPRRSVVAAPVGAFLWRTPAAASSLALVPAHPLREQFSPIGAEAARKIG